jgi:structural maintenance of chromosome 2
MYTTHPQALEEAEARQMVVRFPQLLCANVKAQLRPQLAVLSSLGIDREAIRKRPLLLSEGIETVMKFLRLCGVPRSDLRKLLRSYPIGKATVTGCWM